MYIIERSYPKVGVGQTLKQHLAYISSYEHFSKLKNIIDLWSAEFALSLLSVNEMQNI